MRFALQALAATTLLAASATAQTTTQVNLFSTSFGPKDITINIGDTVLWNWVPGPPHNVVSGPPGILDGIFNSGVAVSAPETFQVTFDQAFLDANPVPGNRYDYWCAVHLPGMVGSVTVNAPVGQVNVFGTGVNAAGSLRVSSGSPGIGGQLVVALENTADPTAGPGLGLAFFATAPDLAFPSGTLLPGFGLASGAPGELLIDITPPNPVAQTAPKPWAVGQPVTFQLPIPNDPGLVGQSIFVQGALIDTSAPDGIGLTNGLELVFG